MKDIDLRLNLKAFNFGNHRKSRDREITPVGLFDLDIPAFGMREP